MVKIERKQKKGNRKKIGGIKNFAEIGGNF